MFNQRRAGQFSCCDNGIGLNNSAQAIIGIHINQGVQEFRAKDTTGFSFFQRRMDQVIEVLLPRRRYGHTSGKCGIPIPEFFPHFSGVDDFSTRHQLVQAVAKLPAVGMKNQVAGGVAANDGVVKIILLDIFKSKLRVALFKMQQGAIGIAGGIGVAENPVVVVHLGLSRDAAEEQEQGKDELSHGKRNEKSRCGGASAPFYLVNE